MRKISVDLETMRKVYKELKYKSYGRAILVSEEAFENIITGEIMFNLTIYDLYKDKLTLFKRLTKYGELVLKLYLFQDGDAYTLKEIGHRFHDEFYFIVETSSFSDEPPVDIQEIVKELKEHVLKTKMLIVYHKDKQDENKAKLELQQLMNNIFNSLVEAVEKTIKKKPLNFTSQESYQFKLIYIINTIRETDVHLKLQYIRVYKREEDMWRQVYKGSVTRQELPLFTPEMLRYLTNLIQQNEALLIPSLIDASIVIRNEYADKVPLYRINVMMSGYGRVVELLRLDDSYF